MRNLLLILALAGYISACAPTSETTTSSDTTDANVSEDLTTELDTAEAIAGDSIDAILDSASILDSAHIHAGEAPIESDVLGTSIALTMDQLPKAVRDAYLKMYSEENTSALSVSQVRTSKYPVLYKLESTTGNTDYVHYYTPDGQEVSMPKLDQ